MADPTSTYFGPNGGLAAAIVAVIQAATVSVDVGVYAINDNPIVNALIAAKNRGLTMRVLLDGHLEQNGSSQVLKLFEAGVPLRCAFQYASYHNKLCIADSLKVVIGSANYTYQADRRNAETIVVLTDATTAATIAARFTSDWNGAQPYVAPRPR